MKWIKLQDHNYTGIVVHEAKCPVCKFCVTYNDKQKLPDSCYVCDEKLGGD